MRASLQDGSYPRPQLVRAQWRSLDGPWRFAHDDDRRGLTERWFGAESGSAARFERDIEVPFPPESPASGVHATGFHPVVWYRRVVSLADLPPASAPTDRFLLHFGAVDHQAQVWLDGCRVGEHVGGQTPFEVDVTEAMDTGGEHVLVVRAEDDPHDRTLPRGKQDWELEPHGIWYHRTTGIWQPVWAETVPELRLLDVAWLPDVDAGSVRCELTLSCLPPVPVEVEVGLETDGVPLVRASVTMTTQRATVALDVFDPGGGTAAGLLWSPERPVLVDAHLVLRSTVGDATVLDAVDSYLGMRSAAVGDGHFLLNGEPYPVRSVLDQGYRESTHLACSGTEQLRAEIEVVKAMGFNAARVHQKAEDPRLLYWADRLGLLVWGETANALDFSPSAVELLTREWLDLVRRDRSHPCIVTWVPINESWGVDDIASDWAQQAYSLALASLTRAVDPSRPVVSNEGWEHLDSDILGLHDYSSDVKVLKARYGDAEAIGRTLASNGPADRAPLLSEAQLERFERGEAPFMLTEFGGVSFAGGTGSWGYSTVGTAQAYADLLGRLFDALRECPGVVGFCYTQLMDTGQEANGLLSAAGVPKLPLDVLHRIVTGSTAADPPTPHL